MNAKEIGKGKRTLHRSPNYPAFSLSEALDKAKIIWEKDGKAGTSRHVALQHMGFKVEKAISGPAARVLATLKKFGLTEENGERIKLSQEALDILVLTTSDERHRKALKEAALKPKIYNELYAQYAAEGFPSDETLRAELIRSHEFNPRQVDGFLRDFRSTIEFAGLAKGEHSESLSEDVVGMDQPNQSASQRSSTGGIAVPVGAFQRLANSFPIPLKNQNQATLVFNKLPVDKDDLVVIKKWIDLLEGNLTEAASSQKE